MKVVHGVMSGVRVLTAGVGLQFKLKRAYLDNTDKMVSLILETVSSIPDAK